MTLRIELLQAKGGQYQTVLMLWCVLTVTYSFNASLIVYFSFTCFLMYLYSCTCPKRFPNHVLFVLFNSNTTGSTCGAGTAYPSGVSGDFLGLLQGSSC